MTYPVNFGGLAAGNQPLSDFDTMFAVVGQQGAIPSTAAGTNAITLTSGTNYYVPSSYTNGQIFSFKAANTSSGSVTIQDGGLAFVKLFTAAGVQAASGDVVAASHYIVQYWADLDSSAGGMIILNATVTAISSPPVAAYSGMLVSNGTITPNTQVRVSANSIVLQNAGGGTFRAAPVALTNILSSVNGANGLDTGSVAGSTWYAVYVIFNANTTTIAGLLSLSGSSPTLPAGYTYFARVGWMRTDGSNNFFRTRQLGQRAQYQIISATNTTAYPTIVTGSTSSVATAEDITGVVPPTATEIYVTLTVPASSSASCGPNITTNANAMVSIVQPGSTSTVTNFGMVLETTTISYAASAAGNSLICTGWTDLL